MNDSQRNYEQTLPQLLVLDKKNSPGVGKLSRNLSEDTHRPKAEDPSKIPPTDLQPSTLRQPTNAVKMQQFQKLPTHRQDEKKRYQLSNAKKRNEISKNLINEMINKISVKSITEENYPVSNQTVNRLIMDLDQQIAILNQEASKFQNSLLLNPTNQHLKKGMQALEKNLNQIRTIKDLYLEKIDNRNKISDLQSKIMELKSENRDLKVKIARGIEKIESHIHNLPCQREKELIEEVNKYKMSLSRQKEMRENLENNISSIVLNFKRFYVQADEARKIVAEQLRGVEAKQHELNQKLENIHLQKQDPRITGNGSIDAKLLRQNSNLTGSEAFMRERRPTNRQNEQENIADFINQVRNDRNQSYNEQQNPKKAGNAKPRLENASKQQDSFTNSVNRFSLQDQIEKMRTNQTQFSKLAKRKQ